MMSQVVPTDTGLAGALALLQAATDPKAAKKVLEAIAEAKAEIDAKLADLAERQDKFNQGKFEFVKEREAHAAAVRAHAVEVDELAKAKDAHAKQMKALALSEARHKEDAAARDAKLREREAGLASRERSAAAEMKKAEALAASLAGKTADLDRREEAIKQGEAELRERRARLQEALA